MIVFILFAASSLEEKLSLSSEGCPYPDVTIQNDDFDSPDYVWYGLPKIGGPGSNRTLLDVLKDKEDEYKERDWSISTDEPSHLVVRVGKYFLKFLNLTDETRSSDEHADNEVICHALYQTLGIGNLSSKVGFAYLKGLNQKPILIQVTEQIDGKPFSSAADAPALDLKSYSWQYLMSLLLALPDAKKANILVKSNGDIVFIDKEMAFALPTSYRPGREFVAGVYSALFTHPQKTKEVNVDVMKGLQDQAEALDKNPIGIFNDLICILEGTCNRFDTKSTIVSRWYKHIYEMSKQHQKVIDFDNQTHREKLFWKMLYVCRGIKKITSIIQHKETKG